MFYHYLSIGVVLMVVNLSNQELVKDPSIYTAAVVEYYPITGENAQNVAESNAKNYVKIIEKASNYDVDIIVFAEYGLTSLPKVEDVDIQFTEIDLRNYYRYAASHIPNPSETMSLCNITSNNIYKKSLQLISCAAKKYNMYVVVNHHEKFYCDLQEEANCPDDGFLLYNTNIVFNRLGEVIARYRKHNSWKEEGTNITSEPEISTFQTDFGVTFGQLISADIVISEMPAMHYVRNPNITDIILTTHWSKSELPFQLGMQYYASWAYGTDKTLLSSGYDRGSGIFAGTNGPVVFRNLDKTTHALIIAEIPKRNHRNCLKKNQNFKSFVCLIKQTELETITNTSFNASNTWKFQHFKGDLKLRKSVLLDPKQNSHDITLIDGDIGCLFHIKMNNDEKLATKLGSKHYMYRLIAFDNVFQFNSIIPSLGMESCALIACSGKNLEDCANLYPEDSDIVTPVTFEYITISLISFNFTSSALYMPSTLTQKLEPMRNQDFTYESVSLKNSYCSSNRIYLKKPRNDVMIFGIYGRRYDKDGQELVYHDAVSARNQFLRNIATAVMIIFQYFC